MIDIDVEEIIPDNRQCYSFESKVIALHKDLKDRHTHPLQAWAEMSYLIEFRNVERVK